MSRDRVLRLGFLLVVMGLLAAVTAEAAGPFQFYSVTPCRLARTTVALPGFPASNGPPALSSGVPRNMKIAGLCGVPDTAKAATLNVTFVGPTADGFIKIWPYNTTQPQVSTVNALAGEPAIANGAIVPLTTDPNLNISVVYGSQNPAATSNIIIDVTGYFQ
ncbi:MAG TPA: hypothetical protein VMR54_01810 [Thermoanaerobaculia bacterium]|nr:hypothetical protein [Thermoanaerobaculia bacterium]